MKRSLPILLSLLLCHCGTEVGNGVTTRDTQTTVGAGKNTEGAGIPTNDSASPTSASYTPFSVYFLVACASPFADTIAGTFANAQGVPIFTVAVTAEGRKTVTANGSLIYTITPAPNESPYAIEPLNVSPVATCDSIKTQTLAAGSLQRSVLLTNGTVLSWILQAGTVTSMKVVYSNLSEESWVKSSP